MTLFDDVAEQTDDDAAVQRLRIPWSVGDLRRNVAVAVAGEKGLVFRCLCHCVRPWRILRAEIKGVRMPQAEGLAEREHAATPPARSHPSPQPSLSTPAFRKLRARSVVKPPRPPRRA